MSKIPLIFSGVKDGAVMNEPGAVEQNVRIGLPDTGNDGVVVHHIEDEGRDAIFTGQAGQRIPIDVGGTDLGALCRHRQCRGPSYALARRCNQCAFVCKPSCPCHP